MDGQGQQNSYTKLGLYIGSCACFKKTHNKINKAWGKKVNPWKKNEAQLVGDEGGLLVLPTFWNFVLSISVYKSVEVWGVNFILRIKTTITKQRKRGKKDLRRF